MSFSTGQIFLVNNGSEHFNYSITNTIENVDLTHLLNETNEENVMYPFTLVIPMTVIYGIIFFTGLIGNVSTCIVIIQNNMMHTATNYYLCSLAVSDLLLLISGLPPEMYRIWSPEVYVFGDIFCILQGFAAETSANATVLTITAFTVERYLAICHPFLSHTMSKLSRAVKYIVAIWVTALCLAAPQAMQFGVEYYDEVRSDGVQKSRCTVVSKTFYFQHAFEISTFLFFIGPMTLITVLYVLIALKLRKSRLLSLQVRSDQQHHAVSSNSGDEAPTPRIARNSTIGQKRVIKMLVAVVVAFFICWAPFHAQRLLAVYLAQASSEDQDAYIGFYTGLMHTSGILYFVSTSVNPVLYHIMSKKFRDAFKSTFTKFCFPKSRRRYDTKMYCSLLRHPSSLNSTKNQSSRSLRLNSKNGDSKFVQQCENTKSIPNTHQRRAIVTTETTLSNVKKKQTDSESKFFRPRITSEASQITLSSTVSSTDCTTTNENVPQLSMTRSSNLSTRKKIKNSERLTKTNHLESRKYSNKNYILNYGVFQIFAKHKTLNNENRKFFKKQISKDSVFSTANTISNSSLQDLEESEFNSCELAEYMKQVNSELT